MSKNIIDKGSILLGMGEVFICDVSTTNYAQTGSVTTENNLLGRMKDIRIYSKKTVLNSKQLVNGLVMDDVTTLSGIEFYLNFSLYEHNEKNQAIVFGGKTTDSAAALGKLILSPEKVRIEVKFKFPVGGKTLWFIFPKCISESELDIGPSNTEAYVQSAIFRVLPAVDENSIWYVAQTPCFNSFFA